MAKNPTLFDYQELQRRLSAAQQHAGTIQAELDETKRHAQDLANRCQVAEAKANRLELAATPSRISFPSHIKTTTKLANPFQDGVWLGMGFMVAPFVLLLIVYTILFLMAGVGVGAGALGNAIGN